MGGTGGRRGCVGAPWYWSGFATVPHCATTGYTTVPHCVTTGCTTVSDSVSPPGVLQCPTPCHHRVYYSVRLRVTTGSHHCSTPSTPLFDKMSNFLRNSAKCLKVSPKLTPLSPKLTTLSPKLTPLTEILRSHSRKSKSLDISENLRYF